MAESRIVKIDAEVASKLCTAQVVVSMSNAVKELIENALDAEAKSIEIKLKNFGLEMFEVADSGHGIDKFDLQSIGKAHHTSKLRSFTGLSAVDSYGFRGEAINALCALGRLEIITRTAEDELATFLKLDSRGDVTEKLAVARQVGTSVRVHDIFNQLPVRRKELERNARREFNKVLIVVQSYALCAQAVRISCSHITADGKRQLLLSTTGASTLRSNICAVFGVKQMDSLVELAGDTGIDADIAEQYGLDELAVQHATKFKISGYVSCSEIGKARGSSDRQFVFINRRPCDYPALCKIINEVFKQYNRAQLPVIVLCIDMDREWLDRNITPDKRRVMICNERSLYALVKSCVHQTWLKHNAPSIGNGQGTQLGMKRARPDSGQQTSTPKQKCLSDFAFKGAAISRRSVPQESTSVALNSAPGLQMNAPVRLLCKEEVSNNIHCSPAPSPAIDEQSPSVGLCYSESEPRPQMKDANNIDKIAQSVSKSAVHNAVIGGLIRKFGSPSTSGDTNVTETEHLAHDEYHANSPSNFRVPERDLITPDPYQTATIRDSSKVSSSASINLNHAVQRVKRHEEDESLNAETGNRDVELLDENEKSCEKPIDQDFDMESYVSTIPTLKDRLVRGRVVNTTELFESPSQRPEVEETAENNDQSKKKFMAGLLNTEDDNKRELELSSKLSKMDLSRIHVIGQFNNGFILGIIDKAHLFVVDQHAADEKYMFEMYSKNAIIQSQSLIRPKPLNMNAVSTAIVRDNLEIFRKNGFDFAFDNNEGCIEQVSLTATPSLHGWVFDNSDIDDMINFLTDFPVSFSDHPRIVRQVLPYSFIKGVTYRPAKLRRIFASKACRKSIMIGRALRHKEMEKVVKHLSTLVNPWNCPHGRPTLRYLTNINEIFDDQYNQ